MWIMILIVLKWRLRKELCGTHETNFDFKISRIDNLVNRMDLDGI